MDKNFSNCIVFRERTILLLIYTFGNTTWYVRLFD